MILKRLVFDIIFWVTANITVLLAAQDMNSFLHDPGGQVLLTVLNILWFIPIVGDAYVPQGKIKVSAMEHLYYLTMSVLLLEFIGSAYEYTHFRIGNITPPETVIGLAAICVGFLISLSGWLSIRRYSAPRFQIIEDHKVISNGLYRFIRHPICLSFFLIALGVPIFLRSAAGLVILVLIVRPAWIHVLKAEEKFLLSQLGDEYKVYLGRTKRLIPFVY